MNRLIKKLSCFIVAALVLAMANMAMAETWSAPFSIEDVQPISEAEIEKVTAHLTAALGETDEETGNINSFQIAGLANINNADWYVGRWSSLVGDHISLVTDFLIDPVSLEMFKCVYPDSETIEWYDDSETLPELPGVSEEWPYMSEHGFTLAYDTAFIAPIEAEDGHDIFESVLGDGARLTIAVVDELSPDQYEDFLAKAVYGGEATNYQIQLDADTVALCAAVTREETAICYYLVPFGCGALTITGEMPSQQAAEWAARFDMIVESITY